MIKKLIKGCVNALDSQGGYFYHKRNKESTLPGLNHIKYIILNTENSYS